MLSRRDPARQHEGEAVGSNALAICHKEVALMLKSRFGKKHEHPGSRDFAFIGPGDDGLETNSLRFGRGQPAAEQIVRAVKRAVVSGQLRAGDPFPSVRELSKSLKINPKTAHKGVAALVDEGVLETKPNRGTEVSSGWEANQKENQALLRKDIQRLVVDAKLSGLDWQKFQEAVETEWKEIE